MTFPSDITSLSQAQYDEMRAALLTMEREKEGLSIQTQTLKSESEALKSESETLQREVRQLRSQLDWFHKQLFGPKSERRIDPIPGQLSLLERLGVYDWNEEHRQIAAKAVAGYERQVNTAPKQREGGEHFPIDETKVPVYEVIHLPPEAQGLSEDEYTIIETRSTDVLLQQPSQFRVARNVYPVIRLHATGKIVRAPAHKGLWDRSCLDVSAIAGMLCDKFLWHLPLHRQHQRLQATGITLSRGTLTYATQKAIGLLSPIYDALVQSIRESDTVCLDETPIKAGRDKLKGKMRQGYFWPMLGDRDEVAFHYSHSRGHQVVIEMLGDDFSGQLLSDGYGAYDTYVNKLKQRQQAIVHGQCWAHIRRKFVDAETSAPEETETILALIRLLYEADADTEQIKSEEKQREHRRQECLPIVDTLFRYLHGYAVGSRQSPDEKFMKAVNYALNREAQARAFIDHPGIPLDNNATERAIRPIAVGRKNWMFCWTGAGARDVAIIQSLIQTCRVHGLDVHTYLVDVLQRVGTHPASQVDDLLPRNWRNNYADQPMPSSYRALGLV